MRKKQIAENSKDGFVSKNRENPQQLVFWCASKTEQQGGGRGGGCSKKDIKSETSGSMHLTFRASCQSSILQNGVKENALGETG